MRLILLATACMPAGSVAMQTVARTERAGNTHVWLLQAHLVRGTVQARLAGFQRDDKLSRSESLLLVLLPLGLVAGTSAAAEAGGRCGGGRAAEDSRRRRLTRSAAPGPHRGAHGRGCSGRGHRGVAAAAGQGAARGGAGRCYGAGSPAGEPWPLADRLHATSGLQKAAIVMGEHGTHMHETTMHRCG